MVSVGQYITQVNDPLQRVGWDHVVQRIMNPSPEFSSRISQLRQIRMLDEKQYRKQKTSLPYFCSGLFHPSVRRKENFSATSSFVLDFDHFEEDGLSRSEAFDRICKDPRVKLLFCSPGGDGLKAVLLLSKPCMDFGLYSHFYKAFLRQFVHQYKLEKYADYVTHDVTRATFFSADPDAYYNPQPDLVSVDDFIHLDNPDSNINKDFDALRKAFAKDETAGTERPPISDETLTLIKQKLNPGYRPKNREKNFYVPEEIKLLMPDMAYELGKNGIAIVEVKPIQYGKQIRIAMGHIWAELNLFYGKRGFSVVKTTKSGSNADLASLGYQLINQYIDKGF